MSSSHLEQRFINIWLKYWPDIDLHREHRFHGARKWRFDFAHLPTKTAIEINGGIWTKSGHSSGTGLQRDYEKSNEATLLGWSLFVLCDPTVVDESIVKIGMFIKKKWVETPSFTTALQELV